MTSPLLAALVASATIALLLAPGRSRLRPAVPTPRRWHKPFASVVLTVIVVMVARQVALVVMAAGAVMVGVRALRRRHRARAATAARRERVIEACALLASDLRAGRVPAEALAGASAVCPELVTAVSAARLGDDVAVALDQAAEVPGADGLRAVAAGWRVAEQSGAALAGVVERIATALRADEQVRRQVTAGLAGTRATGRLLAGLPILGLALGHAVGADPIGFLTGTPIGWLCLTAGLVLAGAGLTWIERLADSGTDGGR